MSNAVKGAKDRFKREPPKTEHMLIRDQGSESKSGRHRARAPVVGEAAAVALQVRVHDLNAAAAAAPRCEAGQRRERIRDESMRGHA